MTKKVKRRQKQSKPPMTRSEVMARVKGKNTRPEMRVRRALWAAGFRYRLHGKDLPGRPDLVFPGKRVVVFVHGCFWHGHAGCPRHRIPKSRVEWWTDKISRNMARDAEVREILERTGWRVTVIWECETERPEELAALADKLREVDSI